MGWQSSFGAWTSGLGVFNLASERPRPNKTRAVCRERSTPCSLHVQPNVRDLTKADTFSVVQFVAQEPNIPKP